MFRRAEIDAGIDVAGVVVRTHRLAFPQGNRIPFIMQLSGSEARS